MWEVAGSMEVIFYAFVANLQGTSHYIKGGPLSPLSIIRDFVYKVILGPGIRGVHGLNLGLSLNYY